MSRQRKKAHAFLLLALAGGMFGFAFALVPLYNAFCEITGLNGKTSAQAALLEEISVSTVPADRSVTVSFLASAARGLPWEFRPAIDQLVVRPGEINNTTFYVRNRSQQSVTGQAVPSVTPGQAALYFRKLKCFCFEQQKLAPGAEAEIGVRFVVDSDLPTEINELTLSYTMFHVVDADHEQIVSRREQ